MPNEEHLTWVKEVIAGETHTLEYPPVNKVNPDGSVIINYNLNPAEMTKDGFSQWTDAQLQEWHEQYDPPAPEPEPLTVCTKYQLITCLKTHFPELLTQLRTAYAQNTDLQFYWNTVNDLDRDNADFQSAVQQLGITEEQLDEIFQKIENR